MPDRKALQTAGFPWKGAEGAAFALAGLIRCSGEARATEPASPHPPGVTTPAPPSIPGPLCHEAGPLRVKADGAAMKQHKKQHIGSFLAKNSDRMTDVKDIPKQTRTRNRPKKAGKSAEGAADGESASSKRAAEDGGGEKSPKKKKTAAKPKTKDPQEKADDDEPNNDASGSSSGSSSSD